MIQRFEELLAVAAERGPVVMAVAAANESHVLEAVADATERGIVRPILVGPVSQLREQLAGGPLADAEMIDAEDPQEASKIATQLVSSGKASILMKGLVETSTLLKEVLNKEYGLRTGKPLSHVAVADVPTYHKLLFLTDAAMFIAPSLEDKKGILENAVTLCHALGIENPKVAVLAAKENVSEKMPATMDAKQLTDWNREGVIQGCTVDGPLALDNAISKESIAIKGIDSPVGGDADVLLVPAIEAGNIAHKMLSYLAKAEIAGVIMGATHPVVLTSRADTAVAKVNSIALAVMLATQEKANV